MDFALIGLAGFIAPRHLKAIKETGHQLVAALDKSDSVGIIDNYFPQMSMFTEFERFDRHIDKLRRKGQGIDYLTVCSPNYLHDSHIRFGLRAGANVICEKPLVLNPWNIDAIAQLEQETGRHVHPILQLRHHPSIVALKQQVDATPPLERTEVELTYITSRGAWYYASWKGDQAKSGGVAMNIGCHFYDILTWIFGSVQQSVVHLCTHDRVAGLLELEKARVRYFLSIDQSTLPPHVRQSGKRTHRLLSMNGTEVEFSDGFTNLHTTAYQEILNQNGFSIEDARRSIELVYTIRNTPPIGLVGDYHPLALHPQTPHPFKTAHTRV